jgi:hypothetical protein
MSGEDAGLTAIEIGLTAAIITVAGSEPRVLTVSDRAALASLPLGPFDPRQHRTLEMGLRAYVSAQTGLSLGYVEQLYTFGDRGRHKQEADTGPHIVSVGYLALTRSTEDDPADDGEGWHGIYRFLPWEDWRQGRPKMLDALILPRLIAWAGAPQAESRSARLPGKHSRLRLAFGLDDFPWDEERVLERYELLYEAGLLEEAVTDGRVASTGLDQPLGVQMRFDHRRVLATAASRLRSKIKYRPVVFELMPERFTLTELQATVEAIAGRHLHKQNFRRLVEGAELVEPTGETSARTGGRPAALYRFRRKILDERPAPGLKLGGRG